MSLRLRRGGNVAAPPPPSDVFGPTNGSQPVRDGARPNVILDVQKPAGAINVAPGSFTQASVNSSGAGAKFWLLAGTHTVTSGIRPLADQQFWCQNGAIIDGGSSGADYFMLGDAAVSGVQVHGGTWQHQGNTSSPNFAAAILANGGPTKGSWLIEDATLINNANTGISVASPNSTVRRCKLNSNGRYGMSCANQVNSPPDHASDGLRVEYCEIAFNNTRNLSPGDDAGSVKFVPSRNGTFRYIWCHDNTGFGLWWDGDNEGHTIEENVCENNDGSGIFYEIGNGGVVIRHNYIAGNGDGIDGGYPFNTQQITISCAPSDGTGGGSSVRSEINNNDVDSFRSPYDSPIVLFNHGDHPTAKRTRNWYVHHNRMWIRPASGNSRTGLCDACQPGRPNSASKVGDIGTSPGAPALNLFDYNEYHVANTSGSYWEHDTNYLTPGARDFVGFQSRGHEAHGTVVVI